MQQQAAPSQQQQQQQQQHASTYAQNGGPLRVRGRRVLQSVQVGGRVACVALLRGERRRWGAAGCSNKLPLLSNSNSSSSSTRRRTLKVALVPRRRTGDGGVDLTINSQLRWGAPSGVSRSQSIPRAQQQQQQQQQHASTYAQSGSRSPPPAPPLATQQSSCSACTPFLPPSNGRWRSGLDDQLPAEMGSTVRALTASLAATVAIKAKA
jgi:hypothetical protein